MDAGHAVGPARHALSKEGVGAATNAIGGGKTVVGAHEEVVITIHGTVGEGESRHKPAAITTVVIITTFTAAAGIATLTALARLEATGGKIGGIDAAEGGEENTAFFTRGTI